MSNTTFAPDTNPVAPSYVEALQKKYIFGDGAWTPASAWGLGFANALGYPPAGY